MEAAIGDEGRVPIPEDPTHTDPDLEGDDVVDDEDLDGLSGDALTVMQQLRDQREELKSGDHILDLDIPGYNGMLVARYKPVRFEIIEKLTRRAQKEAKRFNISMNLLASTDTLIEACDQIMLRVNGELTPIPTGSGLPVRFDSRLSEAMGFEAEEAREVVAGVFGNEFGVITHNVQYSTWLRDVTKEVDENLLGE